MRNNLIHIVLSGLFVILVLALPVAGCAPSQPPVEPATATSAMPPTAVAPKLTATPAPENQPETTSAGSASSASEIVRIILVPEQSEARYRVREQLVGVSLPGDAVGATRVVTGTIVGKLDGTIVSSESRFRVDLRTLKSNEDRRDNFLRRNTLQTDRFPFAEFVPTEARGLPLPLPESGEVQFQLVGDLTIRDVTRQVVWEVTARIEGDEAFGQAKTSFPFAAFNPWPDGQDRLTQPRVPVVLSVEDNIRLEMDFHVRRQLY